MSTPTSANSTDPDAQGFFTVLGTSLRDPARPAGVYVPPAKVTSIHDLLSRLFLGDRDDASFRCQRRRFGTSGSISWSIRYVDAMPGTHLDLEYHADRGLQGWRYWQGTQGGGSVAPTNMCHDARAWGRQTLWYGGFPSQWDQTSQQIPESHYNLRYIPFQPSTTFLCGLPYSPFKLAIIPVALDTLPTCIDGMKAIRDDQSIASPVTGILSLTRSTIDYVRERCLAPVQSTTCAV